MKKMKFQMMNEVHVQEMTFKNMKNLLEDKYDLDVAGEPTHSEPFGDMISEGTAFFWVDGDKVPVYEDCMEWVIEEVLSIETADDFEDEEEDGYDTPYYDASLMQYMI